MNKILPMKMILLAAVIGFSLVGCQYAEDLATDAREAAKVAVTETLDSPEVAAAVTDITTAALAGDSIEEDAAEYGAGFASAFVFRFLGALAIARIQRRKNAPKQPAA